jgi:hypothetical protein
VTIQSASHGGDDITQFEVDFTNLYAAKGEGLIISFEAGIGLITSALDHSTVAGTVEAWNFTGGGWVTLPELSSYDLPYHEDELEITNRTKDRSTRRSVIIDDTRDYVRRRRPGFPEQGGVIRLKFTHKRPHSNTEAAFVSSYDLITAARYRPMPPIESISDENITDPHNLSHSECDPISLCTGIPCVGNLPTVTHADFAGSTTVEPQGIALVFDGPVTLGSAAQLVRLQSADSYGRPFAGTYNEYGDKLDVTLYDPYEQGYSRMVVVKVKPGESIPSGRLVMSSVADGIRSDQVIDSPSVTFQYHFILAQDPDAEYHSDWVCGSSDFNCDGDFGLDSDIEAFFACLSGNCPPNCSSSADFNGDGDFGTDEDIQAFFRVLAGGFC